MTECDRSRTEAPGLASLPPDDPERVSAMAHASACAGCARALREGERLQRLLLEAEVEPLPVSALDRASRAIREQLRREARRRVVAALAAVSVSVVLIAFARARSRSPTDWALAAALGAVAVAVAAVASRRPLLAAAASVLASLAAAALSGLAPRPLAPVLGIECVATELASSALVAGAVWLTLRGAATSGARSALAAAAVAGALAGDAALQVTCAAHTSVSHLLAFHVGGVLVATAGATLLSLRTSPRVAT